MRVCGGGTTPIYLPGCVVVGAVSVTNWLRAYLPMPYPFINVHCRHTVPARLSQSDGLGGVYGSVYYC